MLKEKILMEYTDAQAIYTVNIFKICWSILYHIVIGCKNLLVYESLTNPECL